MDWINALTRNPAFWAAISGLFNAVIDYFFPEFPRPLSTAINALLAIVFATIAGSQASQKVAAVRAARAAKAVRLENIPPGSQG